MNGVASDPDIRDFFQVSTQLNVGTCNKPLGATSLRLYEDLVRIEHDFNSWE